MIATLGKDAPVNNNVNFKKLVWSIVNSLGTMVKIYWLCDAGMKGVIK